MKNRYLIKKHLLILVVLCGSTLSTEASANTVETRLLPSPRVTSYNGDAWQINTRGRLELDGLSLRGSRADKGSEFYDRRTRIGLDAAYGKFWSGTFEVDFSDEWNAEYTDVMLEYHNQKNTRLQFGHFKEYFGMERTASSSVSTFNERAAIDTFTPQRGLGLQFARYGEFASASFGIFTDSIVTNSKKDDWAATSRLTYGGAIAENEVAHVGASVTYRKMDRVSFSSGPDTSAAGFQAVSTGNISDISEMVQGGLELAYAKDALRFEGEYMHSHVERTQNPALDFNGWYAQAAWMLTGEMRPYSAAKEATFGAVDPFSPFSLTQGQWGAWELAARYQELDLGDNLINGGELSAVTAGINWYPNKTWRLTANASNVEIENGGAADDSMMTYSLRLRVLF